MSRSEARESGCAIAYCSIAYCGGSGDSVAYYSIAYYGGSSDSVAYYSIGYDGVSGDKIWRVSIAVATQLVAMYILCYAATVWLPLRRLNAVAGEPRSTKYKVNGTK